MRASMGSGGEGAYVSTLGAHSAPMALLLFISTVLSLCMSSIYYVCTINTMNCCITHPNRGRPEGRYDRNRGRGDMIVIGGGE